LNLKDLHAGKIQNRNFLSKCARWSIKDGCPLGPAASPTGQRGDGRYSAQAAAGLLNVTVYTIADWCKSGKLDGVQVAPRSPWWVVLTPEIIAALRKPVRQYKPRRAKNVPGSNPGVANQRSTNG
jgi:hypothetical protein